MTALELNPAPQVCLNLRSEERENLLYIVEIEEKDKTYHCFSSENYLQALAVAKKVFHQLKTKQDEIGNFGVLIEAEHGRGASYEINEFHFEPNFNDKDDYYKELCNDFETQRFQERLDKNTLFRKIVNREKLNEYQEQRFLAFLKKLGNA